MKDKINCGARQKPERQNKYKSLKTTFLTFSSVMILLVSGCGEKLGQDSEYKKGANAAIEAAEHSLRAQKAVGNADAIAAAETALSAVKAAAKNEADIGRREEAIKAAEAAVTAASKAYKSKFDYYDEAERQAKIEEIRTGKMKSEAEIRAVAEAAYTAAAGAGAHDAIRAAKAAEECADEAFDDAATVHTTDAARKHAFIAKQKADDAVAEAKKK